MTGNEDSWCSGEYDFNMISNIFDYRLFLGLISVSEVNSGNCLVPCNMKRYLAKEVGVQRANKRAIIIWFQSEVEITQSVLTITAKTLISSIGGFIGIGKNLLWIMIVVMSGLGFLINNLKQT